EKMFNLIATDVGRSIIDLNLNPKTPDIGSLITDVIDSVTPKEIEVKDNNGRWYSIWIRPYRTTDNKIDGAVIAFVDIDRIKQADFMNKIVSDLQDYARQPKPSFVEYDLQGLIDDTRSSISIPTTVEVLTSFEQGFPKLTVDPNLLRRAFTNIIANALQAMPDGGQLKIKAWKNKELATISFQDTGKGIPEDIKAKIFNPLFTTRDKGVG